MQVVYRRRSCLGVKMKEGADRRSRVGKHCKTVPLGSPPPVSAALAWLAGWTDWWGGGNGMRAIDLEWPSLSRRALYGPKVVGWLAGWLTDC